MPPLTQLLDLVRSVPVTLLATLCIGGALILAGAYFLLSAPRQSAQPQEPVVPAPSPDQEPAAVAPPDAEVVAAAPPEQAPAPDTTGAAPAPAEAIAAVATSPGLLPAAASPAGTAERARTVLRVVRDPGSGQLAVEVGGRRYASLLDVPEAQRAEIVHAIDTLVHFGLARPAAGEARAGLAESAAPGLLEAEEEDVDWEEEPPAPAPAQAPALDVSARPVTAKPLSPEEVAATQKRTAGGRSAGDAPPSLLAEDAAAMTPAFFAVLNETIERRCEEIPQLQGRHIELRTNADGDLEVVDGAEISPSIDEVPDELVRNLIRAAIAEWEGL